MPKDKSFEETLNNLDKATKEFKKVISETKVAKFFIKMSKKIGGLFYG